MYRVNNIMIEKELLEKYLKKGLCSREIGDLVGLDKRTITYHIHKFGLEDLMNYKKPTYNEDYFSVIDTKEKAYILGYTLADGYINDSFVEYGCALSDKEILEFIVKNIGGIVRDYTKLDKSKRLFPKSRIHIGNKKIVKDINRLSNGTKNDKTFPQIRKDLQHYMLLGFFDGDGCLTWGYRKDRNRLWQKVNFTGSYKLLYAIQKLLDKNNITSSLHPKGEEKCYVLEIASKKNVKAVLSYIYGDEDLIVLKRKYNKYVALRLELGENEETIKENDTISCQASSHELEGVETTGEKMDSLNNQLECPSLKEEVRNSPNGCNNDLN